MKKGAPRGFWVVVMTSVALHFAVGAAVFFAVTWNARARKPIQNVITTELVRLGKERPKDFLPRKEEPPPEPTRADPPPQTTPTDPPPQTKPTPPKDAAPSAKDRLSQLSKVQNALDRLKTEEEPEGREDGSQYGTVAKALAGATYFSEVQACMRAHYSIEGMSQAQVAGKKATVLVRIEKNGTIRDVELGKGSGDARFDQNVMRAAKRCDRVAPPPAEYAAQLRSDGLEVNFE